MSRQIFWCWAWVVASAALAAGCGGDEGPKLVPVSGTVTLDGNPLPDVAVTFHPDQAKGNKSGLIPAATANAQGKYELEASAKKGAEVGWYKVLVIASSPQPKGGEMPQVVPPPFNKKYMDAETTDLSIEVKADATPGSYDLKLAK